MSNDAVALDSNFYVSLSAYAEWEEAHSPSAEEEKKVQDEIEDATDKQVQAFIIKHLKKNIIDNYSNIINACKAYFAGRWDVKRDSLNKSLVSLLDRWFIDKKAKNSSKDKTFLEYEDL